MIAYVWLNYPSGLFTVIMSALYNIPIPTPEYNGARLQKLATVTLTDVKKYEFFWRTETRQVVIHHPDDRWSIQPDNSITVSLANLMDCIPQNIILKNFYIQEIPDKPHAADAEATIEFYDCDWSDYASDLISLKFDVEIDTACTTDVKRLLKVVRTIIKEEEEYADMPELISMDRPFKSYSLRRRGCDQDCCDDIGSGEGVSYCECME